MPVLRMLDGELELFERSLLQPDAVRYLWKNAGSQFGVIFTLQELEALLGRIGSTPAWDWVWLRKEFDDSRWTQACGRAQDGLVVEIDGPHLVARHHAARRPRSNIGTPTWEYYAARAETHDTTSAAAIQIAWIDTAHLDDHYELRTVPEGPPRL